MSSPTSTAADIGELLREHRRAVGLTQEELAERAGVSPRSISEVERGGAHVPRRDTLDLLASALGLETEARQALVSIAAQRRKQRRTEEASVTSPETDGASRGNAPPRLLTRLFGRQHDLEQLGELLRSRPMLTLVGPGGVGKTRLAQELIRDNHKRFEDGCWQVDLAGLFDPALVLSSFASAIGLREIRRENVKQILIDSIGSKHMLLIVDNCEHLIEACADIVAELLDRCPRLQILATSREPLAIPGETRWQVQPLVSPATLGDATLEQLRDHSAVQLFLDRASALGDIHLTAENAVSIARICISVDGIPLALELAAAATRMLSLNQIADRLNTDTGLVAAPNRFAPPRHRTMRATIDWSHDLLSEAEQILLRRLAVFGGGWNLTAVEKVCGGRGIDPNDALELLAELVDKSLVVVDACETEARYRLLEPVRHYALERLEAAGEADGISAQHAAYFLELAQSGPVVAAGAEEIQSIERFELEFANLRIGLRWALTHNATATSLAAATALFRFWERRGHFEEGCAWLEQGLASDDIDSVPALVRSGAMNALAFLYWRSGAAECAERAAREALAISRAADHTPGVVHALLNLGMSCYLQQEYTRSDAYLEESIEHARRIGRQATLSVALTFLARVRLTAHGPADEGTSTMLRESLSLAEAARSHYACGHAYATWGDLHWEQRDTVAAVAAWKCALLFFSELADPRGTAGCIERIALALQRGGHVQQSAWLFGAAHAQHANLGMQLREDRAMDHAHFAQYADEQSAREAFPDDWASGRAATVRQAASTATRH